MKLSQLFALLFTLALLEGCAKSAQTHLAVPEPIQMATPNRYDAARLPDELRDAVGVDALESASPTRAGGPEVLLTGPLAGAPAISRQRSSSTFGVEQALRSPRPLAAPTPIVTRQPERARPEMLDIEAHLAIDVADLKLGRARVRELTQATQGQVINDVVEDTDSSYGAAFSLRVPSNQVYTLLDGLERLGKVRSSKVETKEVSRQAADTEMVLRNLKAALARYEALLAKAESVTDMTALENQLTRLRTAIERVTTDLEWLRDRVARSTVYVTLTIPKADQEPRQEAVKFYPGLRAPWVADLEPHGTSSGYFGGGLSVLFVRQFNLDLDLLTNTSSARRNGVDLALATLGVELFSDRLGGGRRRYLNPYLGFRAGYANLSGDSGLLLGGSLGLELIRTPGAILDLQARAYAMLGPSGGTHTLLQPCLAIHLAY